MKVLFASAEATPFYKSGGLGDVIGALPKELVKMGVDARVVLPYHTFLVDQYKTQLKDVTNFTIKFGWQEKYVGIKELELNGVHYYFIDSLEYFERDSVYGYDDDGERYSFFSMAVIEMMEKVNFIPNILHANDWHTAVIPVLLKDKYKWIGAYSDIKTVFSIHNIQFQGIFGQEVLHDWFGIGYDAYHDHGLQFHDNVNLMKGGIYYSDFVTTVSPQYASEIQTPTFGEGLDGVLRDVNDKLSGILNGIDYEINDPVEDNKIFRNYSKENIHPKIENKRYLQKKVALPVDDEPLLIGMVSRLTHQKGFSLVQHIMSQLMERNVQIVVLGTGEKEFENSFKHFNHAYPNQFKAVVNFDVQLAQEIYAGADLFLMPSAFEPCGLSQMISMRYGTLPLVHEVGGLKDTVRPLNHVSGEGNGFSFYDFNGETLLNIIDYSLATYFDDPDMWKGLQYQAMSEDFSWKNSAVDYLNIYKYLSF